MEAKVDEIADGVYRLSAYVPDIAPPAGFTFNHFLVLGDEPLLFHTGLRRMFPVVRAAVEKVLPAEKLRWICFGHYEADECGSMNEWLAVAPRAEVMHGQTGNLVSLNDMADRTPRVLADGEVIDLGHGKRVRYIDTPHIPHGWDAGVLQEESTGTLLCGDLFTQRYRRARERNGGPVPLFESQSGHGSHDPRPRSACSAHARPHARTLVFRRRRGSASRACGRL
jgi:flavorubredoxin